MILDIILAVLLIWAMVRGFREGIVVQLGGLAGLFIGIYLAFRLGPKVGSMLGINSDYSSLVGFVIIVVLVILGLAILGRIFKSILSFAGLGMLDKLGGLVLSVLKIALITGILLYCFDWLNERSAWVDREKLHKSRLYGPVVGTARTAFPYINDLKETFLPLYNDRNEEPAE